MARRRRLQEAGATYHVTTHGVAELAVFPTDASRERFLELVAEVGAKLGWRILGYCLLTTHYHLLVTTTQPNIADGMRRLNGRYARWLNVELGRRGHVWDARYHGDAIRSDSHLLETIRYVALNPVRAGTAPAPARWRWSSYAALVGLARRPAMLEARAGLELFGSTRKIATARVRAFVEVAARPDGDGLRLRFLSSAPARAPARGAAPRAA